ncbi:MAG: hypothetical protein ACREPM_17725 [Gemmatimonadaceae bacterium]
MPIGLALRLALGVILIGFGSFVAIRPLFTHAPLTGTRWLDLAFAFVFLVRGVMTVRLVQRRRGGMNR